MTPSEQGYFITGTDTGIGKTLVSTALLSALSHRGLRVAGMKPVASGACWQDGQWRNDDVEALMAASNVALPRRLINPYLLRQATAPHIAAASEGQNINLAQIEAAFQTLCASVDQLIVEGAGGFLVPLNARQDMADLALRLGLPVILVVGIRLGCISHALLSTQAIAARGLRLAAWVANIVSADMPQLPATIASLQQRIAAPMLGCIPYLPQAATATAEAARSAAAFLNVRVRDSSQTDGVSPTLRTMRKTYPDGIESPLGLLTFDW